MHSIGALRNIRELQFALFGGCPPSTTCMDHASREELEAYRAKSQPAGKGTPIGTMIYDLTTREIKINEPSLKGK